MARTLTPEVLAELDQRTVRPFAAVALHFSAWVYFWSGVGDLDWNGETWKGAGELGGIGVVQETTEIQATSLDFSLSGIDEANIAIVLGESYKGREALMYLGFRDPAGAVVPDPVLVYSGRMDGSQIQQGTDAWTVTIRTESRLVDLERPPVRRYTDQDQQAEYPGDLGFEFVAEMQNKRIVWGRS